MASEETNAQEDNEHAHMPGPQGKKLAWLIDKTATLIEYTAGWFGKRCLEKRLRNS